MDYINVQLLLLIDRVSTGGDTLFYFLPKIPLACYNDNILVEVQIVRGDVLHTALKDFVFARNGNNN